MVHRRSMLVSVSTAALIAAASMSACATSKTAEKASDGAAPSATTTESKGAAKPTEQSCGEGSCGSKK